MLEPNNYVIPKWRIVNQRTGQIVNVLFESRKEAVDYFMKMGDKDIIENQVVYIQTSESSALLFGLCRLVGKMAFYYGLFIIIQHIFNIKIITDNVNL